MDESVQKSCVVCEKASVISDHPHATRIGIDILKRGGNAADAAIATMVAISALQPHACGFGGDCQCLFYRNKDKNILAVNGSGRTGKNATLEKLKATGIEDVLAAEFRNHGLWVSVPGAVAGMFDILKHFGSGKLTMEEILEPVIDLAKEGAPVPYWVSRLWKHYEGVIKKSKNAEDMLIEGNVPKPGDIVKAPKLSQVVKNISIGGPGAFYTGDTAKRIAKAVQGAGGVLTTDDLEDHLADPPTPNPCEAVFVDFHGFRVWEMKPNTVGIVVLVVLNTLKGYDLKALGHNSHEYIHLLSEATKYAFLECWEYLCDPKLSSKPLEELLTEETAQKLKSKIDPERVFWSNVSFSGSNTSYVAVVDEEGNGCSFICSTASSFGTGIIPDECGFVMHDRARSMSMDEKNTNVFGPRKLPRHTIIPSLVTDASTGELLAVFGVIGRWMQPQGHVQVLLNMVVFGMDPQVALNQSRFFVGNPEYFAEYKNSLQRLCFEKGIDTNVVPYLESKGHKCQYSSRKQTFGKGHVIARPKLFNRETTINSQTWCAGADPRCDGSAMGF